MQETARFVSSHQYTTLYVNAAWFESYCGHKQIDAVIDCGCGFGFLTSLLARRRLATQYIGVDRESAVVAAARRIDAVHPTGNLKFEKVAAGITAPICWSSA